jgi:amidohydrolase
MNLIDAIKVDAAEMARVRKDIHAHPELCYQEARTSALVADQLRQFGVEVHTGLGVTGVVGVIKGHQPPAAGQPLKSLGLRADMDALPIQELNTFEHASQHPGKMHACGHDGHTATLLAAAKHLAANRDFAGTVYVIFQPAEEGGGGAREMIKDGLFERFPMDAVFALHNWPGLPVGLFAVSPGPVMASSNEFRITVRGKGAHAAMPHMGIDPVPVAAAMVQSFQTIVTRNNKPVDAAVISVTMINAGEATNVIPNTCEMRGTVRTFSVPVLDLIEQRMREVAQHTAAAYGATCDFEFVRNYPPTINDATQAAFAKRVFTAAFGAANVGDQEPTMGAEDFAYMLMEKPGAYIFLGNGTGDHRDIGHGGGPCTLHNPSYDFNDDLIGIGATGWVRLVNDAFKSDAV